VLPLADDQRVVRYMGERTALVETGDAGARSVVDSGFPLRARDEAGDMRPVDLDLDAIEGGWEPANGALRLRFGDRGDRALSFEGDFAIALSRAIAGVRSSNEIFFADVERDTDALFAPVASGARVAFQLRSDASPEDLRLAVHTAPGVDLRLVDDAGRAEAIEFMRAGKPIGLMSAPVALDADGEPVDVGLRVDGDTIVVHVEHRGRDLMYPIAVDPVYENQDSWKNGANTNNSGWVYYQNIDRFSEMWGQWYAGLGFYIVRDRITTSASNSWFGEYQYWAPNAYSYIHRADFLHVRHDASQTATTQGMWSPAWGGFQHYYWSNATFDHANQYVSVCADGVATTAGCDETVNVAQSRGNYVQSSISPSANGIPPGFGAVYLGGARIWMSDWEAPTLQYFAPMPSGWVRQVPAAQYNGVDQAHVRYDDRGLGIWGLWMDVPGMSRQYSSDWGGCSGARSSLCPNSRAHTFSLAGISEGVQTVTATGQDVLAKTTSNSRTLRIDRGAPSVALSGPMSDRSGNPITANPATLRIDATDGSPGAASSRSGVASIAVRVDGSWRPAKTIPGGLDGNAAGSDTIEVTGEGIHRLMVEVKDQVGNTWTSDEWSVLLDQAAPSTPQLSHAGLPSGWTTRATPRTTVSSSDAGAGISTLNLSYPALGGTTQTVTYRFGCAGTIASRCPASGSNEFSYDTNAMPEGLNQLSAGARDAASHDSPNANWEIKVDRSAPQTTLSGPLSDKSGNAITASAATLTIDAVDGSAGASTSRSGVASIAVSVDGSWRPAKLVTCGSAGNCGGSDTVEVVGDGVHTLLVEVKDQVGNTWTSGEWKVMLDRAAPTVTQVSHTGLPTGWTEKATPTTTVSASDGGTGLASIKLTHPTQAAPGSTTLSHDFNCAGTAASPCPATGSASFSYDSDVMPQGERDLTARAYDKLNRESAPAAWTLRIDRDAPGVGLSGTLYDRRNQEVPNGVYQVHVHATDGDAGSGATARSGVVHVELRLDGDVEEERDVPCVTSSCALDLDWSVDVAALAGGAHRVDVLAIDQLDHRGVANFEFTKGCCLEARTQSAWSPSSAEAPQYGDVTGDGLDDAIGRDILLGKFYVAASNGHWFGPAAAWGDNGAPFMVGDVNGDGFADLLCQDAVTGDRRIALSDGTRFAPAVSWGTSPPELRLALADVDADGKADAVTYDRVTGAVSVAYSDGEGFEPPFHWTTWNIAYGFELADVTGDGAADAIGRNAVGDVRVGVSDAGSFATATSWGTWAGDELRFADVDGDDLADAITRNRLTGAVDYGSSTGESFEAPKAAGSWPGTAFDTADVTGDGKFDLTGFDPLTGPLSGQISVAASNAPTPLGPLADVTPADADVDVEPEALDELPLEPLGGAATSAQRNPPIGFPRLATADERVLREGRRATDDAAPTADQIDQAYRRLREAGVSLIRFWAYWGGIERRRLENSSGPVSDPATGAPLYEAQGGPTTARYDWAQLDTAVEVARSWGMRVHLTLTGTASDNLNECLAVGTDYGIGCTGSSATPDLTGDFPTDPGLKQARIDAFGDFVHAAVERYAPHTGKRAYSYGIWNEPNLGQWLDDNNEETIVPTRLYRRLYQAAYDGWKAAAGHEDTQILIGELAANARSGRSADEPGCPTERPGEPKCLWTSMDFLKRVVSGASGPIEASGVAYHPYQHKTRPNRQPARYKKNTKVLVKGASGDLGISRLGSVNNELAGLCNADPSTHRCRGEFYAPGSRKLPGLYLSEFGYLNQPRRLGDTRDWHTELERSNWLYGSDALDVDGALNLAQESHAKWMLLYHAIEAPPDRDTGDPTHDYGLFSLARPPAGQPNGDLELGPDIHGTRRYGKGGPDPSGFGTHQRRRAYCAIRRWAIGNDYFDPTVGDSYVDGDRMNACPSPLRGEDKAENDRAIADDGGLE
jgi:hypothetical protein